jgi:uncharacterized protein YbaA (DUF1428 family)
MADYVDGFLVPVPKRNVAAYRRIATQASKIWLEHGAREYRECIGDDLDIKGVVSLAKQAGAKKGETVVFAWVVYGSRAERDRTNARVMKDSRIAAMMAGKKPPFDMKRMGYSGFRVIVEAFARGRGKR